MVALVLHRHIGERLQKARHLMARRVKAAPLLGNPALQRARPVPQRDVLRLLKNIRVEL